jgi:hypothetical protein
MDYTGEARRLLEGESFPIGALPRSTGGGAGVYTAWYCDRLLTLGRSNVAPGEGRPTNLNQADGVRGRLVKLGQQPGVRVERALNRFFREEFDAVDDPRPNKRASVMLRRNGRCRYLEFESGDAAEDFYLWFKDWLAANDITPLVDAA